ncbi:hydrogenase 4 subunit B, partial [bacterium M00.F.Ca.ET.141.01.1.1]
MMSTVALLLCGPAALLATAILAAASSRLAAATRLVYGSALVISVALLVTVAGHLAGSPGEVSAITLPIGLPWTGARFRLDGLSAFFLVVVNLGGA